MASTPDVIAQQIQVAFATKNLDAFGDLLADDARWGDDTHPRRCRSRADVIATFSRVMTEGVDGEVAEVVVGRNAVMCRVEVRWPQPGDNRSGVDFWHVYLINDGKISEIRRYDDRDSALEALAPPE
jgi:ketosteroid isomerase-like protein